MTPDDEMILGRYLILYPLLFSLATLFCFDLIRRAWRTCRKHKGEFWA